MHRIGRAGRFGRKGVAINFLSPRDEKKHSGLQEFFNMDITPLPENVNDFV
jgi:translation initiation factor 4A